MCYCPDNFASFSQQTTHRARKPRTCYECHAVIQAGEFYVKLVGVWDGDFDWHIFCVDCDAWGTAFAEAQRRECDCSGWELGAMWNEIAEFCREHLGYDPRPGRPPRGPRLVALPTPS